MNLKFWQKKPGQGAAQREDEAVRAREEPRLNSEQGYRMFPESRIDALYRRFYTNPDLLAAVRDIRYMDRMDPRVKKIHTRMARTAVRGGIDIETSSTNKRLLRRWRDFILRTRMNHQQKLESHCRGLVMEGNIPVQWVVSQDRQVVNGVRMPSETIMPQVTDAGVFEDPAKAYTQLDLMTHREVAAFSLYQLTLGRLDPDNWDDMGSMGRPYLDATRSIWQKLTMTEEDLVVRRRERAPQRLSHVLEGATVEELDEYENHQRQHQEDIAHDFFQNKPGGVSAIQGDANLDQIADVSHLLDTFFSGAPAPKGLFGYSDELNRDILEDLKRDYYEEIDAVQDTLAWVYEQGFRLDLLLSGINPDRYEFKVQFAERRTETANQATDRALKLQALGASEETVFRTSGLDPNRERAQRENEDKQYSPYPEHDDKGGAKVSVTPGNSRKGESATTVSTRRGNG